MDDITLCDNEKNETQMIRTPIQIGGFIKSQVLLRCMSQSIQPTNTSGKWGSEDGIEEQVEALDVVQDYVEFDNDYSYTESDKQGSNLELAEVIGFWVEETSSSRYKVDFVVYLELENDKVEIRFPLRGEGSGFVDRNFILQEFLKMFGVKSDCIEDILGRKVLYQDHRSENSNNLDFGLTFYNSRKTKWSQDSQKLSMFMMLAGVVGMIPLGLIESSLLLVSFGVLIFGFCIGLIDMVRRRKDCNGRISIKNYLIRT